MGLSYTDYAEVTPGDIIPGRWTEDDPLDDIVNNYNRLVGRYGLHLVGCGRGTRTATTSRPYDRTSGAQLTAWSDIYEHKLPVCRDFSTYDVLIYAQATGSDVELRVTTGAGATAAQTITAGAGWTTLTFNPSVHTTATDNLTIEAHDTASGTGATLDVASYRISYTADISPLTAGARTDSGAYPIDVDAIDQGEPLSTLWPHLLLTGARDILECRPRVWSWSEVLTIATKNPVIESSSATETQMLVLPIRSSTGTVHVWVHGNGPAGNDIRIASEADTTGVHTTVAGSWVDLSTLSVLEGEDTLRLYITSNGSNDTELWGFTIYEVWPSGTVTPPRNYQTTAAEHAYQMDSSVWSMATRTLDHVAFVGRYSESTESIRIMFLGSEHVSYVDAWLYVTVASTGHTLTLSSSADGFTQSVAPSATGWVKTGPWRTASPANGDWCAPLIDVDGGGPDGIVLTITTDSSDLNVNTVILREVTP